VTGTTLTAPSLLRLRGFSDTDGLLTVGEFNGELPFEPRRVFFVSQVPAGVVRADHAQRTGAQVLVAAHGRFAVDAHTVTRLSSFVLDEPTSALHVPPGNWITCRDFSPDAVMLVLASDHYDRDDQIEDFGDYLRFCGAAPSREVALTS
jgi:UDP-2-acetamido-3-amino-2,3-dideoxy-glucuronate N-acetyltransferase